MYVTFSVPAIHLSTIKTHMTGDKLPVTATPQDADAQPSTGTLTFVDNAVDTTTDTIKLKATFANADHALWPGQFARVSLRLTTLRTRPSCRAQAVQTGQDGQFVFVVKPDSTVEQRPVTVGQRMDDDVVVEKGLTPGETIVTEGQLRLEPGTRVTADRDGGPRRGGREAADAAGAAAADGGGAGSGQARPGRRTLTPS